MQDTTPLSVLNPLCLEFPLRGEWKALQPPGHHTNAFDFMKIGENRKTYRGGNLSTFIFGQIPSKNFHGWAEPVYSPIGGVVKQACGDWPDNKNVSLIGTIAIWFRATFLFRPSINGSTIDIRPNAGNHVMIQSDSGEVAFMAHMRSGSIKVSIGQRIVAGQLVGEVGNSGNTTAPHLHLNLFDQMDDPLRGKVIPFIFQSYDCLYGNTWKTVENAVPQKDDLLRS